MIDKRLTKEQATIIGCFTGISCGPFSDMHEVAERLMGRPIFTHEFASPEIWKTLRNKAREEFIAICYEEEA